MHSPLAVSCLESREVVAGPGMQKTGTLRFEPLKNRMHIYTYLI